MYIERIKNQHGRYAVLLRHDHREDGKVRKVTYANLSHLPDQVIDGMKILLKGGQALASIEDVTSIVQSLPHGHVYAALATARRLGLPQMLDRTDSRERNVALGLILSRLIAPASKLATLRRLHADSATSTLGCELGIDDLDINEPYRALDWLVQRQDSIEQALAKKHLSEGTLCLYDVTSTYFEGECCPLAKRGYSRDHRPDRPQIVVGLLTNAQGCPVSVTVFPGNTADPSTLTRQLSHVTERFGLSRLVWIGDRGLITSARIREELAPQEGMEWVSALNAKSVQSLYKAKAFQLSIFDERDLGEIESPDYPGERLVVCRNPALAEKRRRRRAELLDATETALNKVLKAVQRKQRPLHKATAIADRVGRVLDQWRMRKHFAVEIREGFLYFERRAERIAAEAALDGIYIIRTSLGSEQLCADEVVQSYKRLAGVERAFRHLKGEDLRLRPVFHRTADRVRAHVFLCMLAYYVEWHMRRSLAPLLFHEEDPTGAAAGRDSAVAPAARSASTQTKTARKRSSTDFPVMGFRELLDCLGTITRNLVLPNLPGAEAFLVVTRPTPR